MNNVLICIPIYKLNYRTLSSIFSLTRQVYERTFLSISLDHSVASQSDLFGELCKIIESSNLWQNGHIRISSQMKKLSLIGHWQSVSALGNEQFNNMDLHSWGSDEDYWDKDFVKIAVKAFQDGNISSAVVSSARIKNGVVLPEKKKSYKNYPSFFSRFGPYRSGVFIYGLHRNKFQLPNLPFPDIYYHLVQIWFGKVAFVPSDKILFYYLDKRSSLDNLDNLFKNSKSYLTIPSYLTIFVRFYRLNLLKVVYVFKFSFFALKNRRNFYVDSPDTSRIIFVIYIIYYIWNKFSHTKLDVVRINRLFQRLAGGGN
jgi:hypothetical protein